MMGRLTTDDWLAAAVIAAFALRLFVVLWRQRNAGAVLIDLGGSADQLFVFVFSGVLVAGGFLWIFRDHSIMLGALWVSVGMGVGLITLRTTRSQLCEAGFWRAGRLIPWDKIEAYKFSASPALHLKIQGERMKFYCDVPPALRVKAEDVLASKCHTLQPNA